MLLAEHENTSGPESAAFLALLLFHSVRLDARLNELGGIVLFDDQDLNRWDLSLLKEAFHWFELATNVPVATRYHAEAMIAAEHCRGKLTGQTDWDHIVSAYQMLCRLSPSLVHHLNCAIAVAHRGDIDAGIQMLDSLDCRGLKDRYYLWHAAQGSLLKMADQIEEAAESFRTAWSLAPTTAEKELICQKIDALRAHDRT